MIGYGRYAVVGVFVLAAIMTPPDVASQLLMAAPLLLLYGLSIGVAYVFGKKPEAAPAADGDEG
jgi:sec-independent protein translocase protein TatC